LNAGRKTGVFLAVWRYDNIISAADSTMLRFTPLTILLLSATFSTAENSTFRNPINPSADPWLAHTEGKYHLTTTSRDRVELWSASTISGLKTAEPITLWEKGTGVWAGEFHHLPTKDGERRWYGYFTKTDGEDIDHRMWVMESTTDSIRGPYSAPRQILTDPKNEFYAIDGHVFEHGGKFYFAWAGHPGHRIYISLMKDPFTLEGDRVLLPASGIGCEEIREGPFAIRHGDRTFLTYSACDTGKPDYQVGYLWIPADADPMKPASWIQHPTPLLSRNDEALAYGPGHHSFFKSPDGKEDWIAYHAKTTDIFTYKGRTTRVQKLTWDGDGFPQKIIPQHLDTELVVPSGEPNPPSSQD
jgi:GH43 family beta-xylosidase